MGSRARNRLTDRSAKTVGGGKHCDGGGLYLQVVEGATGLTRSWLFRFKERWMGLGPYPDVTLAEARQKALEARKLLLVGLDPIEQKRLSRAAANVVAAKTITFDQASAQYISSHRHGWKNAKHASQWEATLAAYVSPIFGNLPVTEIDAGLVLRALEPIWTTKPETASRVRGRIDAILDWAKARGYRTGENPARWKGHLDHLLPKRGKVKKVEHHAALPYAEVPAFMVQLHGQNGAAARALEFAILTAARTGEVLGARWDEIDLATQVWTVAAERMKGEREHRVPLSEAAAAIIKTQAERREGNFVFPGARGAALSNMAFLMLLRRMGVDVTAHGFRSSFRDWAGDQTHVQREVVEAALAHTVGDKAEQAYRRGDALQKRRALMQAWADYCVPAAQTSDNIVAFPVTA
jgi:integrase